MVSDLLTARNGGTCPVMIQKAPETSYCCYFESNIIEAFRNTTNNLSSDDDNTL